MASTAIPQVKAAIITTLTGAESLSGVTIANGGPEPTRPTEYVWLFAAKSSREFKTITGPQPKLDETLKVSIRIVAVGGKAPTDSEAKATALLEAVETAIRANDTFGENVVTIQPARIEDLESEPLLFDTKHAFAYTATVTAKARI